MGVCSCAEPCEWAQCASCLAYAFQMRNTPACSYLMHCINLHAARALDMLDALAGWWGLPSGAPLASAAVMLTEEQYTKLLRSWLLSVVQPDSQVQPQSAFTVP